MKLPLFIFLFTCCVSYTSVSQITGPITFEKITILKDNTTAPIILDWVVDQPDTICPMYVELEYELNYISDTTKSRYNANRVILQIGENNSKYFILRRQVNDLVYTGLKHMSTNESKVPGLTLQHTMTPDEQHLDAIAGQTDLLNSEIWQDNKNSLLNERVHDYDKANYAFEYNEALPDFDWELAPSDDTVINGYVCSVAHARFRGRDWTVWFTPELPINSGPWKFNGLPGAVLRAEDSQKHYVWECVAIKQVDGFLIRYEVPTKTLTYRTLKKYLQNVHQSPLMMLGHGGASVFYSKESKSFLDDSWTTPYNPIERD